MGMDAATGKTLANAEHIRQSIADILTTPIGTRVMRRDYGSLIPALLDQPMNRANLMRLYSAAMVALTQWEPRIQINRVTADLGSAATGKITIQLDVSLRQRPDTGFAVNLSFGRTE